ncbi:MAG: hypothetical protein ACI9TV_002966 [Sulfurimonas sp.]|jgi:hypothetical protein
MKNMISLHRGLSESMKLNLVDYYLVNYKKKQKSKYPYLLLSLIVGFFKLLLLINKML